MESETDKHDFREEVKSVFGETLENYMNYAFPMDDLLPISCRGSNSQGGMAITLLDSLDTLIVMNKSRELRLALEKIDEFVNFDLDFMAHVFEVNIRVLGGLLSAHVLLKRNPALVPNYTDSLLNASLDLGHRLLPAFDTVSGIPRSKVNLRTGASKDSFNEVYSESDITCCACGGTLLLEMGMLSRLSGQSIFEEKAKIAVHALFNLRSALGLLGNTVNIQELEWKREDSSIGAGGDSIYEYLLKAYMLFGDVEYLKMFTELYAAVMQNMRTPKLAGGYQWIADVHINEGHIIHPWISSLSAFWPGMQALAGLNEEAKNLHENYTDIWMKYAALPEKFSIDGKRRHPEQSGYPLRPELIESTYLLYSATKDPHYLELGRVLHKSLLSTNTSQCGFGSIKDVSTGELSDAMESFFLSESLKYLYLLHSNNTSLINAFVFTTEAHFFPPVQNSESESIASFGKIPQECRELCMVPTTSEIQTLLLELTKKFPLLRPAIEDFEIIQGRRCRACVHITSHLQQLPVRTDDEVVEKMDISWALKDSREEEEDIIAEAIPSQFNLPTLNLPFQVTSAVMCVLSRVHGSDGPRCQKLEPVPVTSFRTGKNQLRALPSLILRKFVPHNQQRQGRLVVLDQSSWREFSGVFHEYTNMKRADHPPSQDCPASVTSYLSDEEVLDVMSCRDRLVFGKLVISEPVSGCGRIQNIDEMENAIVVTEQNSCKTNQKINAFRGAGAIGVVMLKATEEDNEWMYDLIHYLSGLPVFLIRPKDAEELLEIIRCQRESHAMMGKTSSTLLQCPKPRSPFILPSALEETGSKVEVTVTKEGREYLSRAISQGALSRPAIQQFLTSIGANREVLRMFRSLEAGGNDLF
eukprot:g578.t1